MPSPSTRCRATPPPAPPRVHRRNIALLLVLLVAVPALSGCARVLTALAVQPDDTVTGEIVLATPQQGPDDAGPSFTPPPELEDDVEVSGYAQDGYAGTVVRFSGLRFDQLALVTEAAGPPGDRVRFDLRRAGGRVLMNGSVDLTTVPVDRADFQLKISFPGEVMETNGDTDAGTISWTFDAGEVGDVSAVVAFDDPNAPSAVNWTLLLGALVALAAAAVAMLARRTRNPPVSPSIH